MTGRAIETIFLDAGGVIVQPGWGRVSAALARQGISASADALRDVDALARRDIDEAVVIGRTTDHTRGWEYFNRVLAHAGIPRSEATEAALDELREYHRTENLWEEICDGVLETLPELRRLGFTLVVVSNANGRLTHLFQRLDLARRFDHVLDSHDWGVEKPDPRLFRHALETAGARADRTVHVGDLYHVDVAGARAAGLRDAVLFDPTDLYRFADCTRIRRLQELVPLVAIR